tara:strand:+ start:172 stop:519 length:348 start_codon:yes stop_codon:yes gene_type:complete
MAAGGMDEEQYFKMCEQMGWEPKEEEIPVSAEKLSNDAQAALILFNVLPDKWEGMNGVWLGKDYAGLGTVLTLYEIENQRYVFELLKHIENEASKHYATKRKEQESMAKAKAKQK